MKNELSYRSILYSNYFTNQAGRGLSKDNSEKFSEEKTQFTNEIIPLLPKNNSISILDLGCGIGSLLGAMKDHNYTNLIGIDVSEEQVVVAHALGINEVSCIDIRDFFAANNQSFDVICGMDIIEHFTKDELVDLLQLLKSRLNKNGKVIFRTPNADAPFASIYAFGDFTHENLMNSNSAKQLMMATGFQNIQIQASHIKAKSAIKEIIRATLWKLICLRYKLILFASGRSSKEILFTPNMIIMGIKS
jgi:2-polyprenyl-3-methyl-5-hydroxy-6-metoxy-1,4-benzoquinol methylase